MLPAVLDREIESGREPITSQGGEPIRELLVTSLFLRGKLPVTFSAFSLDSKFLVPVFSFIQT